MSNQTTKPFETLYDENNRAIKIAIWRNKHENGFAYSATLSRVYTDKDDQVKSSQSVSGTELLQASELMRRAYHRIGQLRTADKAAASQAA